MNDLDYYHYFFCCSQIPCKNTILFYTSNEKTFNNQSFHFIRQNSTKYCLRPPFPAAPETHSHYFHSLISIPRKIVIFAASNTITEHEKILPHLPDCNLCCCGGSFKRSKSDSRESGNGAARIPSWAVPAAASLS